MRSIYIVLGVVRFQLTRMDLDAHILRMTAPYQQQKCCNNIFMSEKH